MSRRQLEESTEAAQQYWQQFDERLLGHIAVLQDDMAKTRNAVTLRGSDVRQITSSGVAHTSGGRLMGYGIRETTGAASATVYLRDGTDSAGDLIVPVQLAPGESVRDSWAPGLNFANGLFVHVAAGAVEGAIYIGAVD